MGRTVALRIADHALKESDASMERTTPLTCKRLAIIALVVLIGCAPQTPFERDSKTPVPVADCYVSLQQRSLLHYRLGSAVVVAEGVAVTNRHVVEGNDGMTGVMAGGVEFPITHVLTSDSRDLAVVAIPCGLGRPIDTAGGLRVGDPVYGAGTTFQSTIMSGIVVSTEFDLHHIDIVLSKAGKQDARGRSVTRGFVFEGDFQDGFSGGPIVNAAGALVGIHQGRILEFIRGQPAGMPADGSTYGMAYYIADVLSEVSVIAHPLLRRCQ